MENKKIFGLRGATRSLNTQDDITYQATVLYDDLLRENELAEADLISVVFSVTSDLDAKNPASALRQEGRAGDTALFVVQEALFKGSLERVIRVLIHCYLDASRKPVHVYRNGAEILRPDRKSLS